MTGSAASVLAALPVGLVAPADAAAACREDTRAADVRPHPGAPALRLGINPAGRAGASGPAVPAVPDRPARTLAALRRLQPAGPPLALRLNRFFWSHGDAGIRRFAALTRRYTRAGYLVELQLRYHPPAGREGDVAGFERWVRRVVRRFGANPRVVAVQVTNEVNLTVSPDSSDGAFSGARAALVRGVIAAADEARRRRYGQLSVGFNWVLLPLGDNDATFWRYLRDHGSGRFRAAVDWVGLDAYPGTFFPPSGTDVADGMVLALSRLRRCWMPVARLGRGVPIRVEENGWPTGPGRPEVEQSAAMARMVQTVSRLRGTYGVTDYRWFDLRDHDSGSPNFQQHYGVLRDDYTAKPAWATLRRLFARLGRTRVAAPPCGWSQRRGAPACASSDPDAGGSAGPTSSPAADSPRGSTRRRGGPGAARGGRGCGSRSTPAR